MTGEQKVGNWTSIGSMRVHQILEGRFIALLSKS